MPRKLSYEPDQVIEKAMFTFWKHGYTATSVRMLEKDMGINQFSIYSSFKNKQGVFAEVLKMYPNYLRKKYLQKLLSPDSSLKELSEFLSQFGRAIRSGKVPNGCLMVNSSTELPAEEKELHAMVKAYFKNMKGIFKTVLTNAQNKGELPLNINLEEQANYLLGIAQGLTVVAKMQTRKQMDDYVRLAMKKVD